MWDLTLRVDGREVPSFPTSEARMGVFARTLADTMGWPSAYDATTRRFHVLTSLPGPGCYAETPWAVLSPSVTSDESFRFGELYALVIKQFDVERNPRYTPNETTKCNIFVNDVTRAMGCEIPQSVLPDGVTPTLITNADKRELDANAMIRWLRNHGAAYGWDRCSESEAVAYAVEGKPAVVTAYKPLGIGHMAVLLPERFGDAALGPLIAQSGAVNSARTWVRDPRTFGGGVVEYWRHR